MTELPVAHWIRAGLYVVPALLWMILTERTWYFVRTRRPRIWVVRMVPLVTGLVALQLTVKALFWLTPPDTHLPRPPAIVALLIVNDFCLIWSVAIFRHLLRFVPRQPTRPSRAWLAGNYVPAGALTAMSLFLPDLVPGRTLEQQLFVFVTLLQLYLVAMFGLIVWQLARMGRRGSWRPGGLAEVHGPDAALLIGAPLMAGACLLALVTAGRLPSPSTGGVLIDALAYLAMGLPLAIRLLGEVVRGLVTSTAAVTVTAAVYFGVRAVSPHLEVGLRPFLDVAAVGILVVALLPGQAWLRAKVEQVVFRRARWRLDQLAAFLHTLSPELGVVECGRRAIEEFAAVMRLRGVAMLLGVEQHPVIGAGIELDQVQRLWPHAAAAADRRFAGGFGTLEMLELPGPLRDALIEANVTGVFPVASPHRRWGHVFMRTGLLGAVITDEDATVIRSFADQLALLLDNADLLARAVAVERSLAHAEKLAAIGETAARIAHEIRNPVTAARSLAQQLAREPGSPFAVEHELILTELERVERQVAALLRFARREEFRFETVDLGDLVRTTVEQSRPRLVEGGIAVGLEVADGLAVRADREKVRQVLVNLIDNAFDALAGTAGVRRLGVAAGQQNGAAIVRVTDTGPGVPAEALPHLFEPFFSLKDHGTGLGLAIVQRTVEAHGGRIEACAAPGAGMTFEVVLPLAAGHSSPPHGRSGTATGGRTP